MITVSPKRANRKLSCFSQNKQSSVGRSGRERYKCQMSDRKKYDLYIFLDIFLLQCCMQIGFSVAKYTVKYENVGSVYRSNDTHNIKFIVSWITFVYVWLHFETFLSSGKVEDVKYEVINLWAATRDNEFIILSFF